MADSIEFVRNYNDLCTDTGFQFEFFCDRCSSGFRTRFKASAAGMAAQALETAGSLFGGLFGRAADAGEHVRSATWAKARDQAFAEAVKELKPEFVQCPRCSKWVCNQSCWNTKRGLCKECAPDLGVERSAAQASRSVEEVWAHAAMAAEDKHLTQEDWRETVRATCPKCNKPLPGHVKFCPECGAKVGAETCAKCGAKLAAEAKFCPECGEKVNEE
jgi:membrane protease subunit (stomatin/prohibitin family)